MTKKDKRLKILKDTADFYNIDNLSRNLDWYNNQCKYYLKIKNDTRKCAIGRLVSNSLANKLERRVEEISQGGIENDALFDMLPEKIQNLGKEFLVDLQNLHDIKQNWNKNGLSVKGKKQYKFLIEKYSDY